MSSQPQQSQQVGEISTTTTATSSSLFKIQQADLTSPPINIESIPPQSISMLSTSSPMLTDNNNNIQQKQQKSILVSLVCEDRQTNKKCLFPSISTEYMNNNNTISIFHILNSSLSVKAFLKGHLIFIEQDAMDISLGLFPLEMDTSIGITFNQSEKVLLKIKHQLADSNQTPQQSSTQINSSYELSNLGKESNSQYQMKNKKTLSYNNLTSNDIKQEFSSSLRKMNSASQNSTHNQQLNTSEYQTHSSLDDNFVFEEDEQLGDDLVEDEDDDDGDNDIEEEEEKSINFAKTKQRNQSITNINQGFPQSIQQENNESNVSLHKFDEDKNKESLDVEFEDNQNEGYSHSSKDSSILQKRIKKEMKHKSVKKSQQQIIQKLKGENSADQEKSQQQNESNVKKRRRINQNKRSHERSIREGIQLVSQWRNFHEFYKSQNQVKDLQEVANDMGISKKTLDYYYLELRTAEFFNFDFDTNLNQRMGFLRQFIEEQTKIFQENNKQTKIPRQLNFKYRLPEQRNVQMHQHQHQNQPQSSQQQHIYVQNEHLNPNMNRQNTSLSNPFSNQILQNNHPHQLPAQSNIHQIQFPNVNLIQANQQINNGKANQLNQMSQIDGNSTSSLSIYNQTQTEASLNLSDHNFMNQSVNLNIFQNPQHHSQLSQQGQQNMQKTNKKISGCDQTNQDLQRVDHISFQIQDYQIQNCENNLNSLSQEISNFQNYGQQNQQQDQFKPKFVCNENIQSDQVIHSLSQQQNPIARYQSGQLVQIQTSLSNLDNQQQQQQIQKNNSQEELQSQNQNQETIHPYSQKINNVFYQKFLEKQRILKQQEQFEENPTPFQRIFD